MDGEDVSGLSVSEAQKLILDKYEDSEIIITENGKEDLRGNFAYYGHEVDREELSQDLETGMLQV